MDSSSSAMTQSHHARSNSLPSRPNPIISQVEVHLCRLRSSLSTSTSSSSTSLSHKLNSLQDLHDCIEKLLLLPQTQQAIAQESIDGLLEGSLRLLDACNVIKEALLQTKESTQEVQSVMRRRCEAESQIKKFMSSRKVVKKAIQKALKNLKEIDNKCSSDNETVTILGEAQEHAALTLESLLSFINGKKASSWSLVTKLMRSKRVASDEEEEDEFVMVDAAVQSLTCHKGSTENVLNQLKKLDLCIQDFEDGIETLFRSLIKTRVSLLNIINH